MQILTFPDSYIGHRRIRLYLTKSSAPMVFVITGLYFTASCNFAAFMTLVAILPAEASWFDKVDIVTDLTQETFKLFHKKAINYFSLMLSLIASNWWWKTLSINKSTVDLKVQIDNRKT